MLSRKKRFNNQPVAEMNVVPYIDVMLVLLVIFMITAPMLTQGVTVDLPKAAAKTLESKDREPIIVSIDKDARLYLNIDKTPTLPIDPKSLILRVSAELALAKKANQQLDVLVKGDEGVYYGQVVQAMSLLKQAGADKVGLVTDNQGVS